MTQNTSQQGYEEIDLIELLVKIFSFFKRRYKLMLLSCALAALVGFISSYFLILPRYQSSMIISSRSLSAPEVTGLIGVLGELAREKNYSEIAKKTKIEENVAKDLASITAVPNKEYQKYDEKDAPEESTIAITVELYDKQRWQDIQNGIVYYLESNPYVQKKTKIYKESQEKIIAQIQKEVKHLDSMKRIIESSMYAKNNIILNNSGDIYVDAIRLHEAEIKAKEKLAFVNDIEVIQELTNSQKPKKASIKETVFLFALGGLILGFLLSLILEMNRIVKARTPQL
jgi:capsular polysaccharide biosynthesis protein